MRMRGEIQENLASVIFILPLNLINHLLNAAANLHRYLEDDHQIIVKKIHILWGCLNFAAAIGRHTPN